MATNYEKYFGIAVGFDEGGRPVLRRQRELDARTMGGAK